LTTSGAAVNTQRFNLAAADTPGSKPLSASMALTNDKMTLLVFRPVEKCTIQYCLTADAVSAQLPANLRQQIDVIDVAVYATAANSQETAPSFLKVDWDLYPATPYAELMPQPELTDFGWSIRDTKMILVSSDGHKSATLHSAQEIDQFDSFLSE
jgi:hypothetical protein